MVEFFWLPAAVNIQLVPGAYILKPSTWKYYYLTIRSKHNSQISNRQTGGVQYRETQTLIIVTVKAIYGEEDEVSKHKYRSSNQAYSLTHSLI